MQLIVVTKHFWSDAGLGNASRELTKELAKLGAHLITVILADRHVDRTMEPKPDRKPISVDMPLPPPLRCYLASKRAADLPKSIRSDFGDDCVVHSHSLFPSAFLPNEKSAVFITTIHGTERGEIERFRKEMLVHPRELLYRLGYISSWYIGGALMRRSKGHVIALSSSNAYDIMMQGVSSRRIHVILMVLTANSTSLTIETKLEEPLICHQIAR